MKNNIFRLFAIVLFGFIFFTQAANANEINCGEFAALSGVSTHENYKKSRSTDKQFNAFKVVIADHAGKIAALTPQSKRNTALQLILNNQEMKSFILRNALEMTVVFCIDRKNDLMKDVAIEQFDYLLDASAKGMGN